MHRGADLMFFAGMKTSYPPSCHPTAIRRSPKCPGVGRESKQQSLTLKRYQQSCITVTELGLPCLIISCCRNLLPRVMDRVEANPYFMLVSLRFPLTLWPSSRYQTISCQRLLTGSWAASRQLGSVCCTSSSLVEVRWPLQVACSTAARPGVAVRHSNRKSCDWK